MTTTTSITQAAYSDVSTAISPHFGVVPASHLAAGQTSCTVSSQPYALPLPCPLQPTPTPAPTPIYRPELPRNLPLHQSAQRLPVELSELTQSAPKHIIRHASYLTTHVGRDIITLRPQSIRQIVKSIPISVSKSNFSLSMISSSFKFLSSKFSSNSNEKVSAEGRK